MIRCLLLLMPLLPVAAMAQQQQPTLAERNLGIAVSQLAPAVGLYAEDMARKLAERDARIAELERLCGEACRPRAEVK